MSPERFRPGIRDFAAALLLRPTRGHTVQFDGGKGKPFMLEETRILKGTATLVRREEDKLMRVVVPASSVCHLDECAS